MKIAVNEIAKFYKDFFGILLSVELPKYYIRAASDICHTVYNYLSAPLMKLAGLVLSLWGILGFFIWAKARPKLALSVETGDIQFPGTSSIEYKLEVKNEGGRKAEKIKINCIAKDTFGKVKEIKKQEFWCYDSGVEFKKLDSGDKIELHFNLEDKYSNINSRLCKVTYSESLVWKLYLPYCSCVDLNGKQKHRRWWLWRCWKCPYLQSKRD